MIVIGVDVHKQSVTAVAVDEAGRMLDERTVVVGSDELVGWASALDAERLWALEDCRLLTPWLCFSASSMPAAVQRIAISPEDLRLTLREARRTHSIIDSGQPDRDDR
jgi:transposase